MSSRLVSATLKGLPQLSGRLLWFYRVAAVVLVLGAMVAAATSVVRPTSGAAVLALRLCKTCVLITVAAVLFFRRQRDPVAALLALAFLTWAITSSFGFAGSPVFAQLLDRCRFLLLAFALLLFPDGLWQPAWTRVVAVASAVAFLIGVAETSQLLRTSLFLPLAIPCVLAGIASLIARYRASTSFLLRQQLKWVALGLVMGVGLILSARVGAAAAGSAGGKMLIVWEAMFQAGIMIVALGFLVSLLRYRLFDAETVISRSAAYAALTIAMVATFGGTEAAIENLGQEYLGMNVGSISGAMAAAVAAAMLSPLHGRITEWAEARFHPDLAVLKREFPLVLERLSLRASTRQVCAEALRQMIAAVHTTRAAVLLGPRVMAAAGITEAEIRGWLGRFGSGNLREHEPNDRTFPLRLRICTINSGEDAWLLLGPRPDGSLCGKEELEAVRSLFPQLQQALNRVRARESVDRAIARRERRIRRELAEFREQLRSVELLVQG